MRARRAVGVDTSTLAAAAGVEVVSFLTSSVACLPTRTTWPRGALRNEILIFLEIEKAVAGDLAPGPSVAALGLREAFDPVGHVGEIHRPLRAGGGAAAAEGPRGDHVTRNDRLFRPNRDRSGRGGTLFVNVHRGRPNYRRSNFAKLRARGGGRSRRSSGRDSGVGGDGARRPVGVDTSTLAAAAGVEVVSFLTSSAACSPI